MAGRLLKVSYICGTIGRSRGGRMPGALLGSETFMKYKVKVESHMSGPQGQSVSPFFCISGFAIGYLKMFSHHITGEIIVHGYLMSFFMNFKI